MKTNLAPPSRPRVSRPWKSRIVFLAVAGLMIATVISANIRRDNAVAKNLQSLAASFAAPAGAMSSPNESYLDARPDGSLSVTNAYSISSSSPSVQNYYGRVFEGFGWTFLRQENMFGDPSPNDWMYCKAGLEGDLYIAPSQTGSTNFNLTIAQANSSGIETTGDRNLCAVHT